MRSLALLLLVACGDETLVINDASIGDASIEASDAARSRPTPSLAPEAGPYVPWLGDASCGHVTGCPDVAPATGTPCTLPIGCAYGTTSCGDDSACVGAPDGGLVWPSSTPRVPPW